MTGGSSLSEGVGTGVLVISDCLSANTVGDPVVRLDSSRIFFIERMSDFI